MKGCLIKKFIFLAILLVSSSISFANKPVTCPDGKIDGDSHPCQPPHDRPVHNNGTSFGNPNNGHYRPDSNPSHYGGTNY